MNSTKSHIGLMKDPRGMHIRFYHEVFNSNAWRCLSATDQQAYMALVQQLRSTNNGDLSLTLKGGLVDCSLRVVAVIKAATSTLHDA